MNIAIPQATIPMVAAISRVQPVAYGEIVATVSSKSVGPGTRNNIDEFTRTTAGAVEKVGAPKENVRVWIQDVPKENWGIAGVSAKDLGR